MVSAWATKNNLVLGQVKTAEKSNEITSIPELLQALSLKSCLVSIDAMGCQKTISDKIIEVEADYLLVVKDNQPKLKKAIEATLSNRKPQAYVNPVIDFYEEGQTCAKGSNHLWQCRVVCRTQPGSYCFLQTAG